jgi:hypothetical protein
MPRDLYSCAWDFAALGLGTVNGSNAAVFAGTVSGNLGYATGVYVHGNAQGSADGVSVLSFIDSMETQIAGLTVTFSLSTLKYTLSASGTFSVTWSGYQGIALREMLGFATDLSTASSYTSTLRPKYLIVSRLAGQSQVHETYEPQGRIAYAESDNGQAYSTHPVELPTYRDWVQPFETLAGPTDLEWSGNSAVGGTAVRRANVGLATKVTWTWEDMIKHVRATYPFALVDRATSVDGEGDLYKLRGEGAHFDPTRITADYDGHWTIPFVTRVLPALTQFPS